jgi:hypothetical protein
MDDATIPGRVPEAAAARPAVEIGWLLEGDLSPAERAAAKDAARAVRASLAACMQGFDWRVETVERPAAAERGRVEPVLLIDAAGVELDARGWDFAFVVTARELRGRQLSRVLGLTSGLFGTALISTAFLGGEGRAEARLTDRLHPLALHLFARLNGLPPDRSDAWTGHVGAPDDLDRRDGFDPEAVASLSERMAAVADQRVEEMRGAPRGRLAFYARALWRNRGGLPRTILRMRPWSFPLRLRRLTTAAGSALAVLVMTAESWEVAANLSAGAVLMLAVAAVAATSAYLIGAQRLLASRRGPLREQRAVSDAGTVLAVATGMAVTCAGIFALAWLLAAALFGDALVASWTGDADPASVRLRLAALAAALSVVIGALGASFEPYGYFRHVTQVDDEV